jgi:DNA transformation protein
MNTYPAKGGAAKQRQKGLRFLSRLTSDKLAIGKECVFMRDDGLVEFVCDQLRGLEGELEFRRMFGGHGTYRDGVFFGILSDGRFYLKTNDATRAEFVSRGMGPFRPSERQTLKTYYEVPADVLESPADLVDWARKACATGVEASKRRRQAKGK